MPGPMPKDPQTKSRGKKASTKAVISAVVDHDVPPLPDPAFWLSRPMINGVEVTVGDDDKPVDWSPAVKKWWDTIWSSPMSNEFHESDTAQLELACFYLHQVTNPYIKMAERLTAASKYESCVRNFGLTPMSRRSLQWEIEKVTDAQAKNRRRKIEEPEPAPTPHAVDPREADAEDDDTQNPFTLIEGGKSHTA